MYYYYCLLLKIDVASPGQTYSSHKSSAIPIPTNACSISVCPNNGVAATVTWGFLTCVHMLMHVIPPGAVGTQTVCAKIIDCGRKVPCRMWESNHVTVFRHCLFGPKLLQRLSYPAAKLHSILYSFNMPQQSLKQNEAHTARAQSTHKGAN